MIANKVNTIYGTKVKYESRYFTFGSKTKIKQFSSAIVQSTIRQLETVDFKLFAIEKGGYDD